MSNIHAEGRGRPMSVSGAASKADALSRSLACREVVTSSSLAEHYGYDGGRGATSVVVNFSTDDVCDC